MIDEEFPSFPGTYKHCGFLLNGGVLFFADLDSSNYKSTRLFYKIQLEHFM